MIETGSVQDQYFLTEHLDTENSVDMNLPLQLLTAIDLDHELPEYFNSLDKRTMDLQEMEVNMKSTPAFEMQKHEKDISVWLWTLLLLVLPVERILSKFRKQ